MVFGFSGVGSFNNSGESIAQVFWQSFPSSNNPLFRYTASEVQRSLVFILGSMVVTNKLLSPFLQWHGLQQLHCTFTSEACMSITQLKGHRISFMLQPSVIKSLLWNKITHFPGHKRMLILAKHKKHHWQLTVLTVSCHNYHTSYNIDL